MVSGLLSGWGTERVTSYRRLEGSGCDKECAPSSTCTLPSLWTGAGAEVGARPAGPAQSSGPAPSPA